MATGGGDDDSSDFIEPASDHASVGAEDMAVASDYDPTIAESLLGSISSSVYAHCHEHGRRYHIYKYGRYPIPNDDVECAREGVRHALFKELLDSRLHLAPIGSSPQKIVDLGTGFGDWAIEMGERYPSAAVLGLDLSPIQPIWVPPNVKFVVDDIEDEQWIHGSDWDYMHVRMTAVVMQNPTALVAKIFRHLKPGGWVEFQEILPRAMCNDDTMPDDFVMVRFYAALRATMSAKYGHDPEVAERLPATLEQLGFVSVQRKVVHVPLGFWSRDARRMHHAFLMREVLGEFLPALRAKPFSNRDGDDDSGSGSGSGDGEGDVPNPASGLTREQVDEMFAQVKTALSGKAVHCYVQFHFVWAQKPG